MVLQVMKVLNICDNTFNQKLYIWCFVYVISRISFQVSADNRTQLIKSLLLILNLEMAFVVIIIVSYIVLDTCVYNQGLLYRISFTKIVTLKLSVA